MKLIKGEFKALERKRDSFFIKGWRYIQNGITLGYIYKRQMPGDTKITYQIQLTWGPLQPRWKIDPEDRLGYDAQYYKKFSLARKALKKGIIRNIKFLNSCTAS